MKTKLAEIKEALRKIKSDSIPSDEFSDFKPINDRAKEALQSLKELEDMLYNSDELSELKRVLNEYFDYAKRRKRLSELSGLPMMGVVTDAHIEEIAKKLENRGRRIVELNQAIESMQTAIKTIKGE